ncbi:potassium channel family protein [Brochothrix campestris]|uniref:Ktr system potassium uptake protein C n=1 Tax=Brochothrix campestris FSL F6-1037 TaxID=1265861 RepID=W7CUQ2_9LIST|nr:TrkA family potassium uptake protein [Brochothrix campestris]EUJ40657.1 Ktr system potassium uptake protein C [Brochothrix campestris FSL F6-1037]
MVKYREEDENYAIIGLGRFGGSICETLIDLGKEVLAIDINEERVNVYANIATHAVVGNSMDENVLNNLGIRNFDHVVVAIGEDVEASILITLLLKEMGVKHVTVKAQNESHGKVLSKIGADRIVFPERDMGRRIAHYIASRNVIDYLELSHEYSLVELSVQNTRFKERSLIELKVRSEYGLNVVAIRRAGVMMVNPAPTELIKVNDTLMVIGADTDIERLKEKLE